MRLLAKENGYLKFWTRLFESVSGGHMESGFCPSSAGLDGPGSLLLRYAPCNSAPITFCSPVSPPAITAAAPRKLRRVRLLIIIYPQVLVFHQVFVSRQATRPEVRRAARSTGLA